MPNINRLPVEVLTHILGDDPPSAEDPFLRKRHRAMLKPVSKVAYRVCRHWRNIIRNNPAFYFVCLTVNDLEDEIEMKPMKKLISRYQHWAHSLPSADIDVIVLLKRHYYAWDGGIIVNRSQIISPLIDFLVSLAHRWRLFAFDATHRTDCDLLSKALNVRAAQGEVLLARLINVNLNGDHWLEPSMDSLGQFSAPNMETFQSHHVSMNREQLLQFTRAATAVDIRPGQHNKFAVHLLDCMSHIVDLTLCSDRIAYKTSTTRKLGTAESGWQSLERLTLTSQSLGPIESHAPRSRGFSNVTFIHLMEPSLSGIMLFFSSITLPSLHTLVLENMANVSTHAFAAGAWRKADSAYPKIIRLLNIKAEILDFVVHSLAKSAEVLVIEKVAEDINLINPDHTPRVPFLKLRELSFKKVSWKWVKWFVETAKFQDLKIFRWQIHQTDTVWNTDRPALLLVGQSQLREIHLPDFHNGRGGALLSHLAGTSFRRLSLDPSETRYISQDWSHFCETNKQVLLQVNEMKLGIPGGVYTFTRSSSGEFSLAAFSNVIRLSLDLRRAKYRFLQYAFQVSSGPQDIDRKHLAMPHLRSLTLRLEMDHEWFNAMMDLIRDREQKDMALLELIILSFAPLSPSQRRRLDDQLNFFTFEKLTKEDANPLWE